MGERGGSAWPAAILLLAFAAPVFADSTNFLKKPLFFALGAVKPPSSPPDSMLFSPQTSGAVEAGLEP